MIILIIDIFVNQENSLFSHKEPPLVLNIST